jgi:hypothetical protein
MDRHHPNDVVVWIGGPRPASEECRVIHDVVVGRGLTRFEEVAQAVAAELFLRDRRRVGDDAAGMDRLRTWYDGAARRLLAAQHGSSVRLVPAATAAAADDHGGSWSSWRRPVGLYVALGGGLAAFQHVVQRHVFQARPLDLVSGLTVAAYLAAAAVGMAWLLDSRGPERRSPPRWEQC